MTWSSLSNENGIFIPWKRENLLIRGFKYWHAKQRFPSHIPLSEEQPPIGSSEYGHQRKWVDACKAGFGSEEHMALTSSFDYAGPMTETVLMGNLAIRSYMLRKENDKGAMDFFARKKLLWDGENMRITNLEEANQFVGRIYREGFEV